jgi:hypothetical protein
MTEKTIMSYFARQLDLRIFFTSQSGMPNFVALYLSYETRLGEISVPHA